MDTSDCSYRIGIGSEDNLKKKKHILLGNMEFKEEKADSLNEALRKHPNRSLFSLTSASAYNNWKSFKKTNIELKQAIRKWFEDRNITNVNLRDQDLEYNL